MWPDFPANLVAFKIVNAGLLAANGLLAAELVRTRLRSRAVANTIGIVTVLSVPLMVLSALVLSEMLFLALVLSALLLLERVIDAPGNARRAALAGFVIGLAMLVRSHGVVLLPAGLAILLARREWRTSGIIVLATAVTIAPWQVWGAMHQSVLPAPLAGNYGSYTAWWWRGYSDMGLSMISETIARTTHELGVMLLALFSPRPTFVAHALTAICLVILIAFGLVQSARRSPVLATFLAGYLLIVIVWPFNPSRFVWGIWPLLLFLLGAAIHSLRYQPTRPVQLVLAFASAWIVMGYGAYEFRAWRGTWWHSIPRSADRRISEAINYARNATRPDDLIAADDEGAIYLYSGRMSVPVASFTAQHYLVSRSAELEAQQGLVPLLRMFPVRSVLVGSERTFDAAVALTKPPAPTLALRIQYPSGAAFTVLKQ